MSRSRCFGTKRINKANPIARLGHSLADSFILPGRDLAVVDGMYLPTPAESQGWETRQPRRLLQVSEGPPE